MWPFSISSVVPLCGSAQRIHLSKLIETYSGSRTGGQSTRACTNTARVLSGRVTRKDHGLKTNDVVRSWEERAYLWKAQTPALRPDFFVGRGDSAVRTEKNVRPSELRAWNAQVSLQSMGGQKGYEPSGMLLLSGRHATLYVCVRSDVPRILLNLLAEPSVQYPGTRTMYVFTLNNRVRTYDRTINLTRSISVCTSIIRK
jgi:hypothetical protein